LRFIQINKHTNK